MIQPVGHAVRDSERLPVTVGAVTAFRGEKELSHFYKHSQLHQHWQNLHRITKKALTALALLVMVTMTEYTIVSLIKMCRLQYIC